MKASPAGSVLERRRPLQMAPLLRTGLAALLLLASTACKPVVMGNGVFATRTIEVDAFDRVEVEYGITVNVDAGVTPRSFSISGDENIISQYVTVEVESSTLRIGHSEDFDRIHAITVHLDAPELVAVRAREGSRVTVNGAAAASFDVHASESSTVALAGAAPAGAVLAATLDGGARLDARAYPVDSAVVALTTSAQAQLTCTGPVSGTAAGGSSVTVQGGGTCAVAVTASTCTATP
jgi:hypothetical protein